MCCCMPLPVSVMNLQYLCAHSQAIFANRCGTQVLVENLMKTSSACMGKTTESSSASSRLRPHHQIGLEKATQPAFQKALVDCVMKTVLSSASPKKDVMYFVHHGLKPMFASFAAAAATAATHPAALPDRDLAQAERELIEIKKLWSSFVQALGTMYHVVCSPFVPILSSHRQPVSQ